MLEHPKETDTLFYPQGEKSVFILLFTFQQHLVEFPINGLGCFTD